MTFLNPWLLLGALGLALPILAHLLNRHQVRRTDWAAMLFLDRNVRVKSRQIKLRDLLLLLLRCLAILLILFALARPVWNSTSWVPGEQRAGVVIAVDSSFSMNHQSEGKTRFEHALERVRVIGEQMTPGDPFTLTLMGGDQSVVLRNVAFDKERFEEALESLKASSGTLDLPSEPKRIAELVADMDAPQKEVYIITDAQSSNWSQPSGQLRDALTDLGSQANVVVLPVGGGESNLAVTDLELISGVLRKGTTARYRATVKNFGSMPATNISVQCRVDDVEVDSKLIPAIKGGESQTVSLFVTFLNAGEAKITAQISDESLPDDNLRHAVAIVQDKVSVLCVDGSTGDAGRLVLAALMARAGGVQGEDYAVKSVPWLSLPSENLQQHDVVVFADVPEITEQQAKELEQFVRSGRGLIWFAGDNIKASAWNDRAASVETPLLPASIKGRMETNDHLGAGKPLESDMPDHIVCQPLLSLPEDLFSETRFLRVLDVDPMPNSFPVLSLAGDGGPVLLEHSLGRGQVFMFTTSSETTWNNMALTPVFPMVMQQIVTYLSGREFERPRLVGDSLALTYENQPDASDAVFETPSGKSIAVPVREVGGRFVALLEEASEDGYYTARVSVQAPGVPIAVNVNPSESQVKVMPNDQLRANIEAVGLDFVASTSELSSLIDANRTGRSAWRLLMIAALIFLLTECLLADNMLTRASAKKEANNPSTTDA